MKLQSTIVPGSVFIVSAILISSLLSGNNDPEQKLKDPFTAAAIDTTELKKTDWFRYIANQISRSEYAIKQINPELWAGPNRGQAFRAFFSAAQLTLFPSNDTLEKWEMHLKFNGVSADGKKLILNTNNAQGEVTENNIEFNYADQFLIQYINDEKGLRQNFIIKEKPAASCSSVAVHLSANKGWFINKVHDRELHFALPEQEYLSKKITYNGLKAWDAENRELDARFIVNETKDAFEIEVNTENAKYPVTIDPLSTGTLGTPDWIGGDADQAFARYGINVASAGDVNGDGYSDVIVGAFNYDDGSNVDEGRAYVYHGSATGLSSTPNSILDDADQAGAQLGVVVNTAGDVNGDGYSDVIVAAHLYDDGANTDEGRAFVYHGSATGLSASPNSLLDDIDQAFSILGYVNAACTAGDVNGDGYSDVIIGAQTYDDGPNVNEGRALVYYGSVAGLSASPDIILSNADQAGANFGSAVSSAGDVNGDGYSDVIVGAQFYDDGVNASEGVAFVYYGSAAGLSATPATMLDDADQTGTVFGFVVNCAGDINGDGYSDVIIGAYTYDDGPNTNEGRVFVYHGSSTGLSATPNNIIDDADQANAGLGIRASSAGDVNGDGYSDVIVGVYQYDEGANANEGQAYIYFGSASGLPAIPNAIIDDADQANAGLGSGATSAGDVNGDGYSDVIVGAWFYTDGANTSEGRAYVYHGGPDGLSASPTNTPDDADLANAQFGVSVASAGDVNADGYSDIIIGAWIYSDGANTNEGRAFVYHGSSTGLSATPNSILDDADQAFAFFGETVAGAGDVNGDGYSDVIIGADNYDDAGNNNEGRAFVYHGSATGLSAAPNSILDDADQANVFFGVSVASAGDVNGDGYGDVIVGAIGYLDAGNANEGRAFVYHGSATGVSSTPNNTPDDADQPNAQFGWSVACAGDVNGDGYSDVIIGALTYDDGANTDEGRAFVYYGSPIGLSATPYSTPDDANQAFAQFGECVAAAGDVNGDGYSDVIIGAKQFDDGANSDEGRAFIYHGSSTGLSTVPNNVPDDADQAGASFGISVASAGDVNGDGYSDVIIGARFYTDGANGAEGRAFVYHGSATGLSAIPNSSPDDADQAGALLGYSVASGGDVNGDGYGDIIVGAYLYDDGGNTNEGRAFVYYGDNTGGLRNNLRLYNSDLVTPIQQANMTEPNLFGAGLFAKSFVGRQKGKLVWETVKNGFPFSGNPITNSNTFTGEQVAFSDLGIAGTELKSQIPKQLNTKATYIRSRVKYDPVTSITGQVYGPWRYPEGFLRGRRDIGAVALPVKFISFTAIKQGSSALLNWNVMNEEHGVQYAVLHSTDGIYFSIIATISHDSQDMYTFLHTHTAAGKNFYRIRAFIENKQVLSPTRLLNFNKAITIIAYPNPVQSGKELKINFPGTFTGLIHLRLVNMAGQTVWQQTRHSNNTILIIVPEISAGQYILQVGYTNTEFYTLNVVVRKGD